MRRPSLKQLHVIWANCVKARAGWKSEYSGKEGCLHAHHIHGKPNYRLRFELKNGVCITGGEHKFIAHHSGRSGKFKQWAMNLRSFPEEMANVLGQQIGGTDLFLIEIYLKEELKRLKN